MGFYYGQGKPPDDEPPAGSWRETVTIILIVFKALALPLGVLFGALLGLVLVFWLFLVSAWLGFGVIVLGIAAVVVRNYWQSRNPPDIY